MSGNLDGNLYGTAQSGGPGLSGTIWEIHEVQVSSSVPEPTSLVLGLTGLALVGHPGHEITVPLVGAPASVQPGRGAASEILSGLPTDAGSVESVD